MKALIAASNELPAGNEGLEALWDCVLIRMVSDNIKSETTFYKMILQQTFPKIEIPKTALITDKLYKEWQKELLQVSIPDTMHLQLRGTKPPKNGHFWRFFKNVISS